MFTHKTAEEGDSRVKRSKVPVKILKESLQEVDNLIYNTQLKSCNKVT